MDDPLLGSVLGERYRLEECLDKGGMGTVYRATDLSLGATVAIKMIHPALSTDSGIRERFRREAMAASALAHPNIVRALDYGEEASGRAWLVMELVRGTKLSDIMMQGGALAEGRALFIASQVLDALAATHAAGIVHRDLKPPNVSLVTIDGVDDVVKLMDFGIAKLMESEAYQRLTRTGELIGTPSFMAPEQARGDAVDGRADLYALGVLLYGMLANRLPYDFNDPAQLIVAIQDQAPIPLTQTAKSVDPRVWDDVLVRALAKRPEDRFATATEMKAAIAPILDAHTTGNLRRVTRGELTIGGPAPPAPKLASLPPLRASRPSDAVDRPPSAKSKKRPKKRRSVGFFVTVTTIGIVLAAGAAFATLEALYGRSRATPAPTPTVATPIVIGEAGTPDTPPMIPADASGGAAMAPHGASSVAVEAPSPAPEPNQGHNRCVPVAHVTRVEADMIDPALIEGAIAARGRGIARCMRGRGARALEGYLQVNSGAQATFLEWKASTGVHGPAEERCIAAAIAPFSLPTLPTHEGAVRFFLSGSGCD